MKRFLAVVCFLVAGVVKNFAQPCTFTVNAGTDTTICANQSAFLHGTVTPAGAYTYSWTPAASLTGANTLSPVASPTDTTTYILSVTGGGCTAIDSVHVNVHGAALVLFATDSPTGPFCPGQFVQLNAGIVPNICGVGPACTGVTTSPQVGSGTTVQGGTQLTPPTLMGNYVQSGRNQMLYTAAELTAALGGACTIRGIGFYISIFNSNAYLQSFTISVACTNATSLTTFDNNLTQVVAPFDEQPAMGWNDFAFTNPYNWDGVSNLIVDICWYDPSLYGNQNNKAQCTSTAPVNTLLYSFGATDQCGTNAAATASSLRPNARFGYCLPNISNYPLVWTPATGGNAVSNALIKNPTTHPVTSQTYTISVTNGTCVSSQSVSVVVDTSHVSAGPDISSCPGSAVTLTATLVGNIIPGPPVYTWTTLAGAAVGTGASVTVHPLVNTTYVVAMTGGSCTHYDTVNVTLGSLNVATTPTNVTCTGFGNGKIVVTPSNGVTPYSYTWSGNANTGNINTASNLGPGTYTVTVDDVNTCSGTASVTITQPAAGLSTGNGVILVQPLCHGGANGAITLAPAGGTRPYSYSWSNALPPDSTQPGLTTGNYTVTITDANGCSVSVSIPLGEPAQITFGAPVIQNVRCPNSTTGVITVSPTGGTGNYTYKWSQNAGLNSPTAQNLTAGPYTVTVTDVHGCTATATNTVSAAIAVTFNPPTIVSPTCNGQSNGSAKVNPAGGAPPYTYVWTPTGQTTQTATNLAANTYTVAVTDDSLCTTSTTVIVTQPGAIVIVADSVNVLCNGNSTGSINITGTTNAVNPVGYAWGASAGNATTAGIANLAANTYAVTVTDANGCQQNRSFNITQPPALVINPTTPVNDACLNYTTGSIAASATGGTGVIKYVWSNQATTATINNLGAGNYGLTVTDANGCTATASYVVTQPATGPSIAQPVVTNDLCNGGKTGSISITVNGGTPAYTYAWSANAPQINNPAVTGLAAGNYSVTATDAGGCSVSAGGITVTQPTAITFADSVVGNVSCHGGNDGNALVNPSGGTNGGYTYTWNGSGGTNPENGLVANTYLVVVTDGNGCTASTTVVVGQPLPILDSIVRQNVYCNGTADGYLVAYAYGGNAPFTYLWGDGSTTQKDSLLPIGLYTVTIKDSKGCTSSDTASLSQPPPLSFTHTETQVSCPGMQDGTITAVGIGGTPPYNFSVTKDFANFYSTVNGVAGQLDSGLYTIILTDHNGCPLTDTAFIKYPIPDSFNVSVDSTSCFGPQYTDGSIYVTPLTANNMPYTYTIDNGAVQDTNYFGNLAAGPHHIVAINQFGCRHSLDTVVSQPGQAYATVLPKDTTLQLGRSITLTSGFSPFSLSSITSYNWVPSEGLSCVDCPNPVATPYSHVSEYYLTITYNGLCTATDSLRIIVENHAQPFIPNSFSPNGDGNNDVFEIYGENIKTVNLRIFNRWGELVYESTNQFKGWDGYYKGNLQYPGVYTYEAEITFLDDTRIEKQGSVTLIR